MYSDGVEILIADMLLRPLARFSKMTRKRAKRQKNDNVRRKDGNGKNGKAVFTLSTKNKCPRVK